MYTEEGNPKLLFGPFRSLCSFYDLLTFSVFSFHSHYCCPPLSQGACCSRWLLSTNFLCHLYGFYLFACSFVWNRSPTIAQVDWWLLSCYDSSISEIWLPESPTTVNVILWPGIIKINDFLNPSQLRRIGDNKNLSWWSRCLRCWWSQAVLQGGSRLLERSFPPEELWKNEWTCERNIRSVKCHILINIEHKGNIQIPMASLHRIWSIHTLIWLKSQKYKGHTDNHSYQYALNN